MADKAKRKQQQGKVLRIGIVQDGRVVHERLIRPGQSVTVGESPKNTFVFPAKNLPKRFTLFQARGDAYSLNFTDAMRGKIAHREGVLGFDQLKKSGKATRKGAGYILPLVSRNRGKIEVDRVTVLFQFVAAPPESARMVHRQDYRPRLLEEDDPVFLGFLALWSAIATVLMIYVFSTEPVDLAPLEDIPDRFAEILIPQDDHKDKPEEVRLDDQNAKGKEVEKKTEEPKKAVSKRPRRELTPEEKQAAEARRIQKKKEDVLKKSRLLAGIIGTRGEANSGSTVEDVFADSDGKFQDLQSALKDVSGVEVASEQGVSMRGQTDGSGQGDASIGDLAKSGGGSSDVGAVKTKAPRGALSMGSVEATDGEYEGKIRETLRKYTGQVRYCYEARLKENPAITGRLALDINISAGRVTSVNIAENTTGDSALESCVKRKARIWRFPPEVTDAIYLPFALTPS
ncbi:MAG: AgmX/PglI C-terminal domain-containing protein [Oligoflexia bacterium]|nr:AgmX/PglI C-terminal domain-containing protein [Oligoflexia bacterium]